MVVVDDSAPARAAIGEAVAAVEGFELVATLASRVARQFAEIGAGIALHQPPIDLPGWQITMMWHRRTEAHAANIWLRDIIAHVAASA